jgi:hypothetical protein
MARTPRRCDKRNLFFSGMRGADRISLASASNPCGTGTGCDVDRRCLFFVGPSRTEEISNALIAQRRVLGSSRPQKDAFVDHS